ncbi:MAG: hypothetical protein AB7E32_16200 [Desulfovibrio sp.]
MKLVKPIARDCKELEMQTVDPEISDEDRARFSEVVSVELDSRQIEQVLNPAAVHRRQEIVLGVHWHPEFVPLEMIRRRIDTMFPNKTDELLIPTQHNELMTFGDYAGVEVDCYASGFNQKVQLLLHFQAERVQDASVLRSILEHTFKYRSSQLFEFIDTLIKPDRERLGEAMRATGADQELVEFVQAHVRKISTLLDEQWDSVPRISVKNKILRNYFDTMRQEIGENPVNRIQALLKAVKQLVKQDFSLKFFYRATEIIEEVRSLGGGVVIPHPEQFWPILLADYDVDGYEVWNPQSQRYTEFLISVVNDKNARRSASRGPILVFMGDDCHMGEKTKHPDQQDVEKAKREIGVQPAWDDLAIRKQLIVAGISRRTAIADYRARLAG